jgi:iron complex outermembrane recepter protein
MPGTATVVWAESPGKGRRGAIELSQLQRLGDNMKIRSHKHRARWVGLTLATLQCSGLVYAQTADAPAATDADKAAAKAKADKDAATPQTVTVTAQRRSEPLQTTSISATVLSGEDLSRAGIGVVDQLQFASPSATVNNFGQGINFDIRGIGKAETNTQTTTGVITYRDGVATFPGYFAEEPYYDIASVQILRGPQGTFGGQNATGGAVLVESNDPDLKGGTHGYVSGQVGNYHDVGLQGAVNLPLTSTFAARVAINGENRDSFYDIAGPWTGGNGALRSRSARVGLLWKPVPALAMLLKTDVNSIDMGAYPADPVSSTNSPFDITSNGPQKALDRFLRSVLKVDVNFDDGIKLRSISGYQHGNTTYRADLDGTSVGNWAFIDSVYETIWSQELNLISPDTGPFTWLLGAYAQKDTYTFPPGEFIIGVPLGSAASEYRLDGKNPKRTAAVFGQVGYQLTDSLKLAVDGRFSKSATSNDVSVVQYGTPLADQQSQKFTNFSGKVALDWKLSEEQFLYAFVADAARPGGLNVPVGIGLPAPFQAEKVKTVEAGWKSVWLDKHLQTQTSVFFNKYDNFQVTIGYPAFPTFGIELNTANPTHIYGFEEQLQARFGDGWAAKANVGWLHSALGTFYANDPRVHSTSACAPATGPASPSCINLDGHQQTYAPNLTLSASLERSFAAGSNIITPRLNYAYISSQWGTLFENRALGDRLASRHLIGAQVDWANGDFLATLYSTNLNDDHYIAAVGSGLRYAGAPRQYGLRLTKFF